MKAGMNREGKKTAENRGGQDRRWGRKQKGEKMGVKIMLAGGVGMTTMSYDNPEHIQ